MLLTKVINDLLVPKSSGASWSLSDSAPLTTSASSPAPALQRPVPLPRSSCYPDPSQRRNFILWEITAPSLQELTLKPEVSKSQHPRGRKAASTSWAGGAARRGAEWAAPSPGRSLHCPLRPPAHARQGSDTSVLRRLGAASQRRAPAASGFPGGVGRGAGAQGPWEFPRGRGRSDRAPSCRPPRGRRGGARCGLISSRARSASSEPGPVQCRATPPSSMQPRRQQLSVPGPPGPRPVAPLLALLLLLALQGTGAAPAGAREAQEPDDYSWLLSWEPLDGILHQAAAAAVHFLNFRVGSPSALQGLSLMYRGVTWETPREEYHFVLSFTTEHYNSEDRKEEPLGDCHAEVIFRKRKPKPTVNITCEGLPEKNRRQQEDYLLYKHLKQLKLPLGVVNIPDNQGHINTSLKPLWDLAALGSSYVMWEKTTRGSQYHLAQLTGVKQWKTDGEIDFDYTVLLHEFSTQEIIPCRIHLVWYPGKLLKVKYHCQGQETLDEASGTEEGSAVAPRELSNF